MPRVAHSEFGSGSYVGDIQRDPNFAAMNVRDQARYLGARAACPVVEAVTDPANHEPGRGPEAMLNRYGKTNFWFGQIAREVAEVNPGLAEQLTTTYDRDPSEAPVKYEPESVPDNYTQVIAPRATLHGFGLSRLFVEYMYAGGDDREELQKRMSDALEVILSVASEAQDPLDLLALFAGDLSGRGKLDDVQICKHIFSKGWLEEQNSPSSVATLKRRLKLRAPELLSAYEHMSAEARKANRII